MKSFFKKIIFGSSVLEKVYSPINGEILVTEDLFGTREMKIGKVTQSGGLVKKLWSSILNYKFEIFNQFEVSFADENKLRLFSKSNFKCLILGLGGGTLASLIANRYSQTVKITGIEIDPKIIELGKKYFSLDEIKNLKVIIGDAFEYVKNSNHQSPTTSHRSPITRFDLIIVDLYLGQEFPKEAETVAFFKSLKSILEKNGLIIFNRLNFGSHKKETAQFKEKLIRSFPYLVSREIDYNLLLFASLEAQKKV